MSDNDIRPLEQQPVTQTIRVRNDNRFGAVLSAFYAFCLSRASGALGPRRDSYSVIVFDHDVQVRRSICSSRSYPHLKIFLDNHLERLQ
jgi:hypothetical protein